MSQVQNEHKLIKAAQQGDLDAFNALVLAYQSQVYDLVYRILGESLAASQVTQKVFVAAFHALPRHRASSFRTWVLSLAVKACYEELARRERSALPTLNVVPSSGAGQHPGPINGSGDLEGVDLQALLPRGLQGLSGEQRIALVLSDVHGCDYQEIAEITEESVSTVRFRLSQARGRMRDFLYNQGAP